MNQSGKNSIFVGGMTPENIRLAMFSLRDDVELSQVQSHSTVFVLLLLLMNTKLLIPCPY